MARTRSSPPICFKHVARRARRDRLKEHIVFGKRGEHDHFDIRGFRDNLAAGVDAAAAGQPNIHHHDFGMMLQRLLHGFFGIAGFVHHREAGMPIEQRAQPQAHHFMIVDDDNSQMFVQR